MRLILERAQEYCDKNGLNSDDTPWQAGFISTEPISQWEIKRGQELAEIYGWQEDGYEKNDAQIPNVHPPSRLAVSERDRRKWAGA